MKKMISAAMLIVMLLSCFAGCAANDGSSDLSYIQDKGTLVVGITDYEPMDYKDENGEWTGFDAEFARLFAAELGVEVEFFLLSDWEQKFFELDTKNIDVIWNGMTIDDNALANTNCSNPYVINAQVVVMKSEAAGNYTDVESLKNLTLAVEKGSIGEKLLVQMEISDYVALQDMATALMEVASGTADACIVDIILANAMTGEGTGYPDLAIAMKLNEEEYGVGFRKGSDVTAKFNAFMAELMQDGTLDALAKKYNLTLVK